MKQGIGAAVVVVLLAVAAYIAWSKLSHPIDAHVADEVFRAGVLQGNLVNDGQQTIDNAVIHASFKDRSGVQVGEGTAEFQSLEPGKSLPFRIVGPPTAVSETYELKAKSGGL